MSVRNVVQLRNAPEEGRASLVENVTLVRRLEQQRGIFEWQEISTSSYVDEDQSEKLEKGHAHTTTNPRSQLSVLSDQAT